MSSDGCAWRNRLWIADSGFSAGLIMDDDFFRDGELQREEHDNLFGWTVFILLLVGFALACWLGTFYVFGHPENPRSYSILKKLKKIEAPKRFELTGAPPGEFLTARKGYDRYISFTRLQLKNENDFLLRTYIDNFQEMKRLVPYMVGRYTIVQSRVLTSSDMFTSGVVALAQAVDFPQVLVESIYTAPPASVQSLKNMLSAGVTIELKRTLDLSAIVHVERLQDGRLQFSILPLLYGTYAMKQGSGSFSLEPPPDLNVAAGVPVIKASSLQNAIRLYASRNTSSEKAQGVATSSPSPGSADLVRVEENTPVNVNIAQAVPVMMPSPRAATATMPSPAIAKPSPVLAVVSPTPPLVAMNTSPIPPPEIETPSPAVEAATPIPLFPEKVPLQPFLVAKPAQTLSNPEGGHWRTYSPGLMPRGRLVESSELPRLADGSLGSELLYLRGQFTVTAVQENRAVLRLKSGLGSALIHLVKPGASPRIIVEYPAAETPPQEGASLTRGDARPFLITDIRRGADGEINVYAREVTVQP